ncbi:MAG: nickel-dependent lactate racemase [Blastocatellia bacterium]
MPVIHLKYGRTTIPFEYDDDKFTILGNRAEHAVLSDIEIGSKLDHPIESKRLDDLVNPGESVLFVVSDATRQTGAGQIVNLLVRRLIAGGTMPFDISIIFATGIHRTVTEEEKISILTTFISQRIKTIDHAPRDLMQIVRMSETSGGIPVELNRALTEFDHVVLVGGVSFHYFAGFTGGRKLVCPGLASSKTISATHKLAFDCETKDRRTGVGTGLLDGNAVHEAFMEAASKVKISFAVNTLVNDAGEVVDLYCGDWIESHRAACEAYAAERTIHIEEKRDLVIVSCGGYPHDINMIQAHKSLEAASQACSDGGTIIVLAECPDGLGREDFLDWFAAADSSALAEKLCKSYQVNGQTAWSLLRKAERYHVRLVTNLSGEQINKMRLRKENSFDGAISDLANFQKGYVLPAGDKFLIK